jgi:hypothetical protein
MNILTDLRQLLRDNDRAALEEALTTDTIRALLNVAEAVDAIDFYDDDEWHRMWIRVPEAKAALAPLVKEADHE